VTIDGVWIDNWIHRTATLVTTDNYGSLPDLHTPNITVTAANTKISLLSLTVAWYRLPTVKVLLPVDSKTIPGFNYGTTETNQQLKYSSSLQPP
jgi:hypothetical protein